MTDQPNYGFTSGPDPSAQTSSTSQGNGLAVAGLVCGIIGLLLCWVPFIGWILALLGIIFGAIGVGKANKIGGKNKGMGMAGLILGIVGLVAGVIIFVLAIRQAERDVHRFNMRGSIEVVQPRSLA